MNMFNSKRRAQRYLTTYHLNGKIESELYYKNNLVSVFNWYSNGNIMNQGCYLAGHRHGEWIFYHENGIKSFQCNFKEGKFDGYIYEYYSTGKPRSEGFYNNGKKVFIREWTPSGNLLEEFFADDTNGMFRFYQRGLLKIEGSIQKGIYYAL